LKKSTQEIEASFYYALGHEHRRKIIKIIGDNRFSSFTQIKDELGVSTGTIYHHLENLSDLIEQRNDKKYYLTEIGEHAYTSLKNNVIKTIGSPDVLSREFKSPLLKGLMFLTPKKLFIFEEKAKKFIILISLFVLIIGGIFCVLTSSIPFLLFFIDASILTSDLNPVTQILIFLGFFLNFGIFFLLIEGICRLFYSSRQNTLSLLISFGLIMFPMALYITIHLIWYNLLTMAFFGIFDRVLLIFFQVWSLWLLTYNLSIKKGLKMENGLVISLLLHYMSFTVILFISI
jgi:hypothetical protein